MAEQETQDKKKKEKKQTSKGSRVNSLVILICIDLIGFMASLYSLKAFSDANLFLIPAALTLVFAVITAMVYVQMRHQDEDDRQRVAGDVADALSAIIEITKNDQQLMDKKIDDLSEEYQVPAQEIINALKALAKVSLGRSKENATALINSNEAVVTQVMDLQDKIDALEKKINDATENDLSKALDDNSHKVVVGLEDLTHDVQRLDQDMRRLEKVTKDLELHPQVIQAAPVQTQPVQEPVEDKTEIPQEEPETELNDTTTPEEPKEQDLDEPEVNEPETEIQENDDSDLDLSSELEPPADDETETETVTDDDLTSMLEDETVSDSDDVDTGADDLDLTIDDSSEDQEIGPDDLNIDETDSEPEQPEVTEPVEEEQPAPVEVKQPEPAPAPVIDTSDPNKQLSADEIAALFAQANGDSSDTPTAEEPAEEKTEDTTANEPEQQSAAPQVNGDPNRMMTPEEIEALFSNVS